MSTFKIIVAIIVVIGVVIVAVAVNYSWVQACGVGWNGNPNMQYIFSDFEEINGTGVYVSEVIGMEPSDNGKGDQCRNDKKVRLNEVDIYLFDNQGLRNFTGNLGALQKNSAESDNGTLYPIHFESNDLNSSSNPYLSIGDKIKVYGSGSEAKGPAENGWYIRIQTIVWGDTLSNRLVIP